MNSKPMPQYKDEPHSVELAELAYLRQLVNEQAKAIELLKTDHRSKVCEVAELKT